MDTFDGANVDKDLLSQIFADEGDDTDADALLDEMLKDVEEEASKKSGKEKESKKEAKVVQEEPVAQEPAAQEPVIEEAIEEPIVEASVEEPQEAKKVENTSTSMPVFETNKENDPILKEGKQLLEEEGKVGTITTITAGTTVRGGISSDASLEIMGTITGDVECQGKVVISGSVTGNIIASEIYVSCKRLEGSLSGEGAVKIGVGTVILGDVDGTSAYIAGAVKGNIDVNGHVIIDSTAIVQGNIKAKSIQVNNGAVVDGYCSLNYAGVNLDDFFTGAGTN